MLFKLRISFVHLVVNYLHYTPRPSPSKVGIVTLYAGRPIKLIITY